MEADGVLEMVTWLGLAFRDFTLGSAALDPPATAARRGWRFDTQAFYEALDHKRISNEMTWQEVAAQVPRMTPAMLRRLGKMKGRMSVDQVVALASWLGKPPENLTYPAKY